MAGNSGNGMMVIFVGNNGVVARTRDTAAHRGRTTAPEATQAAMPPTRGASAVPTSRRRPAAEAATAVVTEDKMKMKPTPTRPTAATTERTAKSNITRKPETASVAGPVGAQAKPASVCHRAPRPRPTQMPPPVASSLAGGAASPRSEGSRADAAHGSPAAQATGVTAAALQGRHNASEAGARRPTSLARMAVVAIVPEMAPGNAPALP